jgi:enoyl-CoA hydratase/carnithine racemase
MVYETVLVEHIAGVSTLTLNRPPVNAVSPSLMRDVLSALDELEAREATRCIVVTGAGTKAFSAGADLSGGPRAPDEAARFRELGRRVVDRVEMIGKPVIAAIRGWCIGGGTGLAWPCDIRIAAESAKFRAGDVYLGIIPTWSVGMVRLVHYIGRNRTLDTLLLGEDITAREALELGIVSRVVSDDAFEAEVDRVAKRLASGAPLAIRAIKEAVRSQYRDTVDRAAQLEERWSKIVLASADAKEGISAFKEKRKPTFTGK